MFSRSTAQKSVEEKKKAQDEQQQPKQPPSFTWKMLLDDFDEGVVRRPSPACTQSLITPEQSSNSVLVTLAARVVFTNIFK